MKQPLLSRGAFTLIELLLVIGIIAILAAIVIVAINTTNQLGDARDAQRRSDVNTILNAVYQYAIDNNGDLPTGITTSRLEICSGGNCSGSAALAELSGLTGTYIVSIPVDPQENTDRHTGYHIIKANGRVTVDANEYVEQSASISVTR